MFKVNSIAKNSKIERLQNGKTLPSEFHPLRPPPKKQKTNKQKNKKPPCFNLSPQIGAR